MLSRYYWFFFTIPLVELRRATFLYTMQADATPNFRQDLFAYFFSPSVTAKAAPHPSSEGGLSKRKLSAHIVGDGVLDVPRHTHRRRYCAKAVLFILGIILTFIDKEL